MPVQATVKNPDVFVWNSAGIILGFNCFQLVLGRLLTAMALEDVSGKSEASFPVHAVKLLWSDCCQGSRYLTLSIFYVRDFHLLFPHPSSWFFPNRRSGSICKESQFNSSRHWPLCYTWIGYRQANGFRREPCYLKSWITSMRCQHSFNAHCSNLTVITTPCRCCQISKCIIPFLFQSALTIDVSMAVSLVH